jgi:hypothetical protein
LSSCIADKALIDATRRLYEPLQHALQSAGFGEFVPQSTAVEFPGIILDKPLGTKYAFAFE